MVETARMPISFPNDEVVSACRQFGPLLLVPKGLGPVRVMLAIAAVESGGADPKFAGHNCGPRHEPAFDVGGSFYKVSAIQRALVEKLGQAAASSYGPWQMMFCNFRGNPNPDQISLGFCTQEFVHFFNREMARWTPQSLDEIGQIWNTGHKTPDPDYTGKLARAYEAAGVLLAS